MGIKKTIVFVCDLCGETQDDFNIENFIEENSHMFATEEDLHENFDSKYGFYLLYDIKTNSYRYHFEFICDSCREKIINNLDDLFDKLKK
jgi:hypothetical protein